MQVPGRGNTSSSAMTDGAAVRVRKLRKEYGERAGKVVALNDVSQEFFAGTFTAAMGPSGSGKSTMLLCMAGLDRPTRLQVVRMVMWETVITVALGVGVGVGISLLANTGFSAGLFGSSRLVIPWPAFIAVVAGVVLLGFASSLLPAWLAACSTPREVIGAHE